MYYIVYSSITFATGIKNKFRYDAEPITVLHTPSAISGGGCSYSISVKTASKALEIIRASEEYGVKIKGLYKQTDSENFEKLKY